MAVSPPNRTIAEQLKPRKRASEQDVIGVIETVTPFDSLWFSHDSPTSNAAINTLNVASSICFVNSVVMQWLNLCAVLTRRLSLFNHEWNWCLSPAVAFALLIAIFFLYVPRFHDVLGTAAVPAAFWPLPMALGTGILSLNEGRNLFVRRFPKEPVAKVVW